MNYDKIPQELKELPQWVCAWNNSKIPMQATIRQAASSTNSSTWSTYDDAVNSVNQKYYDHIGFVFANNGIVGIDIDCGFTERGFLSAESIDIMRVCKSYTEKSRSGRGVHILLKGTLPFKGKNNRKGIEIYQSGRYFLMTGKKLIFKGIIENQEAIDYVVKTYFPDAEKESTSGKTQRIYTPIYPSPQGGDIVIRPYYPPIPQGCRNLSLTSLAGQLHTQGYDTYAIYSELLVANEQACDPPLPEREVQTIVESVTRYKR